MRPQSQAENAQALLRYLQPIERQELNVLLCRHEIIVCVVRRNMASRQA